MPRPDVNFVNQLGLETTAGTNVTAGKRLTSIGWELSRDGTYRFYRHPGNKYARTGVRHRRWSVGPYTGILDYNHAPYPLASICGHSGTPTTVDTSGKRWLFQPNPSTADASKHYTMQQGDSTAAEEAAYGTFTGINIDFGEGEDGGIDIGGDVMAQAIDGSVSLDSVSATITDAPVSIADLDWYVDSTYAGIGTTKLTDVLRATLNIPSKLGPKFVQNTSYGSFRELVEGALEDAQLTITAENNSQTRALIDAMDTDSLPVRYFQCKALGNVIGATTQQEQFKGNFACKLAGAPRTIRNVQRVMAYELPLKLVDDATMGRPFEFDIINTLSAL